MIDDENAESLSLLYLIYCTVYNLYAPLGCLSNLVSSQESSLTQLISDLHLTKVEFLEFLLAVKQIMCKFYV